jgi:hypothetical protein
MQIKQSLLLYMGFSGSRIDCFALPTSENNSLSAALHLRLAGTGGGLK